MVNRSDGHAVALTRHVLHDVRVTHVQLDELFALLSAVKDSDVGDAEAVERLSRSPHWVGGAMDPVTKLLLTIDVGDRTLAMAQCLVHQVVQVVAPDCVPLFLWLVNRGAWSPRSPISELMAAWLTRCRWLGTGLC